MWVRDFTIIYQISLEKNQHHILSDFSPAV